MEIQLGCGSICFLEYWVVCGVLLLFGALPCWMLSSFDSLPAVAVVSDGVPDLSLQDGFKLPGTKYQPHPKQKGN